ncbi:hypothetical protein Ddye_007006 [Dipteronia dyeriana]|uniref:Uncharacterized protein n=1 Tax=Dipteronia dyeriana TaxID=168575 RepID=A0AAD9XK51_9ROSI|nr:hypothetical protein Ddye_007006 [Dipteronia dyeriana]
MVGFCNVNGAITKSDRKVLWDVITNTMNSISVPWVVGGDFNAVFDTSERIYALEDRLAVIDTKAVVGWLKPKINGLKMNNLSSHEKDSLEENFSMEKVWKALCSCDGNKAPKSDNLNPHFIKAHWKVIREDFINFINEFHKDSLIVKDFNATFIALIPKVKNPMSMGDFRPISLVGSMYKILAKVLANRVKIVMNSIIEEF